MSLRKVESLHLSTTQGPCEIQLLHGDITKLSLEDKVDLLIVSAFPCDYTVASQSLIRCLYVNLGLSVAELANHKDMDLRKYFSCWLSKPLPSNLPYSRLACFEKQHDGMHPIMQIKDMFRGFMPIFNSLDTTVITPLLGTGCQRFDALFVLKALVEAACNWMRVGLPLRCLKIVLYDKDIRKASTINDKCIELFSQLKRKWEIPEIFQMLRKSHDVYISYSPDDINTAEILVTNFGMSNKKIKVFSKRIEKEENKVWPEHIVSAMYGCRRILVILTSSYLETKDCLDEFNIALCYRRKAKELKLIPLCIETLQNLPPVISNVQYMDCRLNEGELISKKLLIVCERITEELITIESSKHFMLSAPMKKRTYDIFVSYPTKHGDKMRVVYEILRKHNPHLNIFYDKLELQTGSNWQQSIYDALEVTRCCLILVAPAYFESSMCQEEFNIVMARCLAGKQENRILPIPLCIVDVEFIPDWFGELNIIDGRESLLEPNMERLANQLHLSFEAESMWGDFHWLITNEVKNGLPIDEVTMQYRQQQLNNIYRSEKLTIERKSPLASCNESCNVLFCFALSDMKFAAFVMENLFEYLPLMRVLMFDTSHENRLSLLDTADYIVMFVSAEYLSTPKGMEELTICFNRQRRSKHRMLHFACTTEIPQCLSYLQILPYSVVFSDSHWVEMGKKYLGKKMLTCRKEGIQGTFNFVDFEVTALRKFSLDILSSIVERDSSSTDIGNLLNIFKIQRKHQQVPLHECLISWPQNYEGIILQEEINKNMYESFDDKKAEEGVHVADSNGSKNKESVGNSRMQNENDRDIEEEDCKNERLILLHEDSLNSLDGKKEIFIENDGKSNPQNVLIADGDISNSETEPVVTNSENNELAEINAFIGEKSNIFPDEGLPPKHDTEDIKKEDENIGDATPENPVDSLGDKSEKASNQGKDEIITSSNIICDPSGVKPVMNSMEKENEKDICEVPSRKNSTPKASICKLL